LSRELVLYRVALTVRLRVAIPFVTVARGIATVLVRSPEE